MHNCLIINDRTSTVLILDHCTAKIEVEIEFDNSHKMQMLRITTFMTIYLYI
jgi:hypothetical protein